MATIFAVRISSTRKRLALVGTCLVLFICAYTLLVPSPAGAPDRLSTTPNSLHYSVLNKIEKNTIPKPGPDTLTPGTNQAQTAGGIQAGSGVDSNCTSSLPAHVGLARTGVPQLIKLAEYEKLCSGAVVDRISFFVPMPVSKTEAVAQAHDVADKLKTFAKFNVKPLVIMEPTTTTGLIDLKLYRAGGYDAPMSTYYQTIKSLGVSDATMGTWVLFPEPNIPGWNDVSPTDFVANVIKTAQLQKSYFPGSGTSIMLDAKSYPSADSWEAGKYLSLAPYLSGIPSGLIDSFGYQAFPWVPPATDTEPAVTDPNVFMPIDLAAEAATLLGTKSIWLNTGTFGTAYAKSPSQVVSVSNSQRAQILAGIGSNAAQLKADGYNVTVHLFAENKLQSDEAKDWSYWHDLAKDSAGSNGQLILKTFIAQLHKNGVNLWLFDSNDQS